VAAPFNTKLGVGGMDLYRYFHPHHNPRLHKTPVRLQELGELEQAAIELRKAVERAEIRTRHMPVGAIREDSFSQLLIALDYVVESLSELTRAHPGDEYDTMIQLLQERKEAPGWENWAKLLHQRLKMINVYDEMSRSPGQEPFKNAHNQ
jgi:hypothetical protein